MKMHEIKSDSHSPSCLFSKKSLLKESGGKTWSKSKASKITELKASTAAVKAKCKASDDNDDGITVTIEPNIFEKTKEKVFNEFLDAVDYVRLNDVKKEHEWNLAKKDVSTEPFKRMEKDIRKSVNRSYPEVMRAVIPKLDFPKPVSPNREILCFVSDGQSLAIPVVSGYRPNKLDPSTFTLGHIKTSQKFLKSLRNQENNNDQYSDYCYQAYPYPSYNYSSYNGLLDLDGASPEPLP